VPPEVTTATILLGRRRGDGGVGNALVLAMHPQ